MKKHFITLSLLLLFLCGWAQTDNIQIQGPGKRLAALAGNNDYAHVVDLRTSYADVDSMAAALKSLGWEVMTLKDGDKQETRAFLAQFGEKLEAEGYEGALFYYSGHGLSVDGNPYLVPIDASPATGDEAAEECVTLEAVFQAMESRVPVKILILDAETRSSFSKLDSRGRLMLPSGKGSLIAWPEEAMAPPYLTNSAFTVGILEHIRTQGLSIEQVLSKAGAFYFSSLGDAFISFGGAWNLPMDPKSK